MSHSPSTPHILFWLQSAALIGLLIILAACQTASPSRVETAAQNLKNYDGLAIADVMVVGTFHFGDDVLEENAQASIETLIAQLAPYRATKVLIEWEPQMSARTNDAYQRYLTGDFDLSDRSNEVFQLGFRLAEELGHEALYLIDDQTDYPGSLAAFSTPEDPFSFDLFTEYAEQEDAGFFDKHAGPLETNFTHNRALMQDMSVAEHIAVLNSPEAQYINQQRMHLYEMRIGIQKNWSGPDWLGRWYRRNIRMLANTLKLAEDGDRLLIIVGDNHKWALDQMIEATPDFNSVSSWEYLNSTAP